MARIEPTYRVKPGCHLAHHGSVLPEGTDVVLAPHVAHEVRHLVEPLDPVTGRPKPWGSREFHALESELAAARPHERVSLIEAAMAENRVQADELKELLAQAKKDEAAAAKPKTSVKTEAAK